MTTLQQIDLADHDAFKDRVPYEWFRTLRHEDPVHFNPEPDGPGFYAVTRYHDIREVHRHTEIYSSEIGGTSLEDSLALWERGEELAKVCRHWLEGARARLDSALAAREAAEEE